MLKKLFAVFLMFIMLMSLGVNVLAEANLPNIYKTWGDFENQEIIENVLSSKFSGTNTRELTNEGANGTSHSLHVSAIKRDWNDVKVERPTVVGENYDVSFYVKALTAETSSVTSIFNFSEGTSVQTVPMPIPLNEWTYISYTVKLNEIVNGKTVKGNGLWQIRFNDGCNAYDALIDELSIVPHGDIPNVDYSSVDIGIYGVVADDGIEVTKPAETYDVNFNDVNGHWAEDTIKSLAKYGYVSGISGDTYAPETEVTRAQFVKMLADLYDEGVAYNGEFKDVNGDEWFAPYIGVAMENSLIADAMIVEGNFYPDREITREEAATIAAKVASDRGAKSDEKVSFTDESKVSDWAKERVLSAASFGIINGYEDGSFKPEAQITRAEAAAILMRAIEVSSRFNIYVDAKIGNDKNDGTEQKPLKTIFAARDMAKEYSPAMQNDITIKIRGEQYLEETFKIDETYSGQNGYKIIYTSWGDEQANITMAKKFRGFELHDSDKNIWSVYVGKGTYSREAYFNDVPGIRSRSVGYLKNVDYIYESHYLCDDLDILHFEHPLDLDFVYHVRWMHLIFKPQKIYMENGRVRIDMNSYFYNVYNNANRYEGDANKKMQTPSYIENAYELLDEEGEWYLDKYKGYMYYIPRSGENMKTMEVKIPIGEEMVHVQGSSYDTPVSHIAFDNIMFEGTTWLGSERRGGANFYQNNYMYGAEYYSKGERDIAFSVLFDSARYVDVTNCDFRHIATPEGALMFKRGVKHANVIGNEIYQVGGVGLYIDGIENRGAEYGGGFKATERAANTYCEYFTIKNNYIHDIALEYHGGAAVGLGHPRHTVFSHNEISNAPYSGMHIGWGWDDLAETGSVMYDVEVSYNYIHDVMKNRVNDGSCIYIVGASSLECEGRTPEKSNKIIGNYLANGWQCDNVYPDQGATSWYVKDNVADARFTEEWEHNFDRTPAPKASLFWSHMHTGTITWMTFENNYATFDFAYNRNQMNMRESEIEPVNRIVAGEWPEEAKRIAAGAGIEREYQAKFNLSGPKILASNDRWQSLEIGKPQSAKLMVLGDYNTEYPISDFEIDWWIDDPEAVTIDENGMMTAHKKGTFEAEAFVMLNGYLQSVHFMLDCGDEVETVKICQTNKEQTVVENLNMVADYSVNLSVSGITTFGNQVLLTSEAELELTSGDDSVATVEFDEESKSMVVTAISGGKTNISGTITYKGKTFDVLIPVSVIQHGSEEGARLPFEVVDLHEAAWKMAGTPTEDGGVLVSGLPNHNMGKRYQGLIAFDMSVKDGSGWPSIAFCDSDFMGDYSTNDCYMIGFKNDHIELQKWNAGIRTMIFGNSLDPIAGPGVPNSGEKKIFDYGERVSMVVGAMKVDGGTRVILNINGKNIIDYLDAGEKALTDSGYFVVYNPEPGGMTFYPYSGITK